VQVAEVLVVVVVLVLVEVAVLWWRWWRMMAVGVLIAFLASVYVYLFPIIVRVLIFVVPHYEQHVLLSDVLFERLPLDFY